MQVEKLQAELERQRGRNAALESQQQQQPNGASAGAAPNAKLHQQRQPPPRRRAYSFWEWVAGSDRVDGE